MQILYTKVIATILPTKVCQFLLAFPSTGQVAKRHSIDAITLDGDRVSRKAACCTNEIDQRGLHTPNHEESFFVEIRWSKIRLCLD